MVFGFLPNLDDALYLSQTCCPLRCLYATHKQLIERQIIVPFSSLCIRCLADPRPDFLSNQRI